MTAEFHDSLCWNCSPIKNLSVLKNVHHQPMQHPKWYEEARNKDVEAVTKIKFMT